MIEKVQAPKQFPTITRVNLTIDSIGLFHGLKSDIVVTQFPRYDRQKVLEVYTTHYYVIRTFMVDRLAGQNTLTALSHILPPLLVNS